MLCAETLIYVDGVDKPLTRMPIIAKAGQPRRLILEGQIGDSRLKSLLEKQGAGGVLRAKLVLRPSRTEALSDTSVKDYYPRAIERPIEFHVLWTDQSVDPEPDDAATKKLFEETRRASIER